MHWYHYNSRHHSDSKRDECTLHLEPAAGCDWQCAGLPSWLILGDSATECALYCLSDLSQRADGCKAICDDENRPPPAPGGTSELCYAQEITTSDVCEAYRSTHAAAERHGSATEVKQRVRTMVAAEGASERFVTKVLGGKLRL